MDELLLKLVLRNSVLHSGRADTNAVFSSLVHVKPDSKKDIKSTLLRIEQAIEEVNKMPLSEQKEKLIELDPTALERKEAEHKDLILPNVKGQVIVRYAPNPNAGMHIGNARAALLNDYFVKKYNGTFILRYDDTDPKHENKKPRKEAYKQVREDLAWLGVKIHKEAYASKRLDRYYELFGQLLKKGKAYICTCEAEEWRELKKQGISCSCRMQSIYENNRKWQMMLFGDYSEGQAVARIKTDIKYKDPAQRDWGAFRIINKPNHPITKDKYLVWPMLDFASAVDDYDFKVTHILRGQELKISELRQKWLYNYMNWTYPIVLTYGNLGFESGGKYSKSKMMEGIKNGEYEGWDDPRLPMIVSYKRRGFQPEAIRKVILDIGITGGKITLEESVLAAANKELIDSISKRYHFIKKPVKITFKEAVTREITLPNHPTNEKLGKRIQTIKEYVYIDGEDIKHFSKDRIVRLIGVGNYKLKNRQLILTKNQEVSHKLQKVHWLSRKNTKCQILMPTGEMLTGFAEEGIGNEKIGTTFQFIRFGYVRLDKKIPLTFIFTHK